MLQVVQYQKNGELYVDNVPVPALKRGGVLVRNVCSLISAGTERSSVSTAQAGLIGKAQSRPDLVRQVVDNIRSEGIWDTYKKVQMRLDNVKALGYSSAGVVIETGCNEFQVGDKVACAGYAYHAEVISVPKNLCATIPDKVDFDEAAFTTLGAIAMQGVRQADVRLGEQVAVIGLGLVGQLTAPILKSAGCRVIGLDIATPMLEMAKELGIDAVVESERLKAIEAVRSFSRGMGVDAVIITAATQSNEPIEIAGEITRDRGRIVIVGAVKADIPRSPFYEKELEVRMSRSYGPGRYDTSYEEKGNDYPLGYVRWTEKRNMEAFLELLAENKVNVKRMITHRFPIQEAAKAYDVILSKTKETYLGVILEYPQETENIQRRFDFSTVQHKALQKQDVLNIGLIGAGNFAQSYLLPRLQKLDGVVLKGVATSTGVSAKSAGKKLGFEFCTTDTQEILDNENIQAVFIATRHDSHAKYVIEALKRNKLVYVEKPLAITQEQLDEIAKLMSESETRRFLMVGYNRCFSKPIKAIKEFFNGRKEPLVMNYRVNAGFVPKTSWHQDESQGGRIIGEVCHFVDVMQFLTDARIVRVFAECIGGNNLENVNRDNVNITIKFDDGSVGTISYLANGDARLLKEFMEVFGEQSVAIMDDFRRIRLIRNRKQKKLRFNGGKGHGEEMSCVVNAMMKGELSPIPFESLYLTTSVTLAAVKSLETGLVQKIAP